MRYSLVFCLGLAVQIASISAANADVRVYRADGSLQCGMAAGRSLDEDKRALEQLGAKVISAEKRKLPFQIIFVCGAPTGLANTYVITDQDWRKLEASFVGPAGFGLWVYDAPTARVYKYDGTLKCGLGREIKLEEMEKELIAANIRVLAKAKGHDGLMHMEVCGGSTGSINLFEIAADDVHRALDLGFAFYTGPTAATLSGDGMVTPWPFPW